MTAFLDIAACGLVEIDVSEVRNASIIRAMTETVRAFETSVYFNETTRLNIQKAVSFILAAIENLKYHRIEVEPGKNFITRSFES
jgi:hypothetical protein